MKKKKTPASQYVLAAILILLSLLALLPVLLILVASFSTEASIVSKGFTFFPTGWTLDGWEFLLTMRDQFIASYGVTIFETIMGTVSTLLLDSMLAYTLARRSFRPRTFLSMMLLGTLLFSGGQLSTYMINTQIYHLKDTLAVLWMPWVGAMHVFMMRAYIRANVTDALIEAAKIDGAGEFRIYWQVCLPLMKPILAALGFMVAVTYWNNWDKGMLYITSANKMPLQQLLMRVEYGIEAMTGGKVPQEALAAFSNTVPSESTRMAMLFTVLGPIMVVYPFFQKYFIKGITYGAVKE